MPAQACSMWRYCYRRRRPLTLAIALLVLWAYLFLVVMTSIPNISQSQGSHRLMTSVGLPLDELEVDQLMKQLPFLPPDRFTGTFDNDQVQNMSSPCKDRIYSSHQRNEARLRYVFGSRSVWRDEARHLHRSEPASLRDEVVLVTAASDNHFGELETFIASVKANYKSRYRLLVFDIGLDSTKAKLVQSSCDICEYRLFNHSAYPAHVKELMTYAWKPIITYELLYEFKSFIWCDTSVRFKDRDLTPLVEHARKLGIATYDAGFNVTCMTQPAMFHFFREEPCLFRTAFMVEANFIAWGSIPFSRKLLGRLWAACALDSTCIAPPFSRTVGCEVQRSPQFCLCHRFDQSALTLLLYRLLAPGPLPEPWLKPQNNPWIHPVSMSDISRGDAGAQGYLSQLAGRDAKS